MNLDRSIDEMRRHLAFGGLVASKLAGDMPAAFALAYEQRRSSVDPKVSGGQPGDVGSVGDRRVQRAIRKADHAVKQLMAADRILSDVLAEGRKNDDLRGSMLPPSEFDRLMAARNRRATRGEQLAPAVLQPEHPSRTRKKP